MKSRALITQNSVFPIELLMMMKMFYSHHLVPWPLATCDYLALEMGLV